MEIVGWYIWRMFKTATQIFTSCINYPNFMHYTQGHNSWCYFPSTFYVSSSTHLSFLTHSTCNILNIMNKEWKLLTGLTLGLEFFKHGTKPHKTFCLDATPIITRIKQKASRNMALPYHLCPLPILTNHLLPKTSSERQWDWGNPFPQNLLTLKIELLIRFFNTLVSFKP